MYNKHNMCCENHIYTVCYTSKLKYIIIYKEHTVVHNIFMRLKFHDFEENLTSIKICDFYFRGHMLHEATPIYALIAISAFSSSVSLI